MRIVAGEFKGRRLRMPRGAPTRPTADRVREALFSMLGDVAGARVLDLYAGSGALGIEALSRGAGVGRLRRTRRARRRCDPGEPRRGRGRGGAQPPGRAGVHRPGVSGPYDLVFCDPPYDSGPRIAGPLAERLPALLSEDARIVTESDKRNPIELPFPLLRERTYGDTRIAIHGR